MARWATVAIFGGVDFSGCRVEGQDLGPFKSQNAGSVDWANSGLPHVQTVNRGVKGIRFGAKFGTALGTDLQDVFDAIVTAESTQSAIRVQITEGIFTVDVFATPDYSLEEWFTWDKHSEGYYEDVVLRWISIGAYA